MKKFFVCVLVLVVLTMVSCAENNPEITKDIYDIELTREDVIIDGFKAGYTDNYGDYYCFNANSEKGYLVFLDAMEEKIEIVDISTYHQQNIGISYKVTYKLR